VSLRDGKLLCIALLLSVVAAANGSPTIMRQDAISATSSSFMDASFTVSFAIDKVVGPVNVQLANLGREFLQPPAGPVSLSSAQVNIVKPLPAVPAAVLMVLIGFLCVSLVKDRRLWLAALAALLWAGQTGIQAFDQLALRLARRVHVERVAELIRPHYLENSNRLRSDIEGTQYIGLLHHLAGMPNAGLIRNSRFSSLDSQFSRASSIQRRASSINTSQPAILSEQYSSNPLFKRLASRARQFSCFSPAFIFAQLPRGPPKLT